MTNSRQPGGSGSRRPQLAWAGFVGCSAVIALTLGACGTTSKSTGTTGSTVATAVVTCPDATTKASWKLVTAGQLTIASDTTYAPAEFLDSSNNPTGYDVELVNEIARRMCLTPKVVTASFDAIIPDVSGPALGQQRYDMSISSFSINPKRQEKVDMIPYFQAGESLLVPTGNPKSIKKFEDMCGKTIAVQDGTVEKDEIDDANGNGPGTSGQNPVCKTNPIKELHFADQNVVVQQVLSDNADASYQDSPVTGYYVSQHPGKAEVGPTTIPAEPEGIVVRKDNPAFETAITKALTAMRTDGTYLRILKKWGQQDGAYPPA